MLIRLLSWLRRALQRLGLLPLIKRVLYLPVLAAPPTSTSGWRYRLKSLIEQANFASVAQVHDLPPIHDHWSSRCVGPKLQALGYASIDDYFVRNLGRVLRATQDADAVESAAPGHSPAGLRSARVVSIGSGNGDFEVRLAERLRADGFTRFVIECVDLNEAMLARCTQLAAEHGVAEHIATVRADFNHWQPGGRCDAVLANMSLHHVVQLEALFDGVKSALQPWGAFIVFDMVGRNGHMRWPEALAIVNEFWRELPPSHQLNRMLNTRQTQYENFDCSRAGFEGIRAQDILPELLKRFHFESFLGFANLIEPFVDRAVGPNFDPDREWDRAFIERVMARDEAEQIAGRLHPTHMLAVMTAQPTARCEHLDHRTAQASVRWP